MIIRDDRAPMGYSTYAGDEKEYARAAFNEAYPSFRSTSMLDELRVSEYGRLDAQDQLYLDYTGGGVYAASQLRQHMELLDRYVFGNPHSFNPTSLAMTR